MDVDAISKRVEIDVLFEKGLTNYTNHNAKINLNRKYF